MDSAASQKCCICRNVVDLQFLRQCSCCKREENWLYHCIRNCVELDCSALNCTGHSCWDKHLPPFPPAQQLHQQIDPVAGLYVNAITYSEIDSERQRALHEEDQVAQWFVVWPGSSEQGRARLCLSDRFAQLCNPGISDNEYNLSQYPSFVSFIGDTGNGKSTLLRAMLLIGEVKASGLPGQTDSVDEQRKLDELRAALTRMRGPVTRTRDHSRLTDPTSLGVHLYKDPATVQWDHVLQSGGPRDCITSILFADCEGFRAGNAMTNSEHASGAPRLRSRSPSPSEANNQLGSQQANPYLLYERPITAPSYASHGKKGSELFYARFLYTFSDVIVFVTKDDQQFQQDMQTVLEWAASAVSKAVNHMAEKTLIIVRNMANLHNDKLYIEDALKEALFENLKPLWRDSRDLTVFRKDYNAKQDYDYRKINNNKSLLEVFFQKVRVCYIPDTAKALPDKIYDQCQELRRQIVQASKDSQKIRSASWTEYNVPILSHLLSQAFEHFRENDGPFDFYTAARKGNLNPISASDHIANFLRHVQSSSKGFSEMFSEVVSMCLVTWVFRNFHHYALEPTDIFSRELWNICLSGISTYREKHQDCAFRFNLGSRCIAKPSAHSEHCDQSGNRVPGAFDFSQYPPELVTAMEYKIHDSFIPIYRRIFPHGGRNLLRIPQAEFQSERERILKKFSNAWVEIKSNRTCFSCLQAVPDHVMLCGHGYCPECVKEFGRESPYYEYGIDMDHCVLCQDSNTKRPAQLIRLKPKCAGLRILTLDGGGVRGIIELVLLEELEARIGLDLRISDFFDLVMGTSTGGIIALGLVMKRLRAREMKSEFTELATNTFKLRRGGIVTLIDPLKIASGVLVLLNISQSIYRTSPLRDGLKRVFGDTNLYASTPSTEQQRQTRVAVTSTKDTLALRCLITNYNRPSFTRSDDFEREDEDSKEMKTWEAGLATAAAPFYFKPLRKDDRDYVDGALHSNLPVLYALEEMTNIWPSQSGSPPLDVLVSIGTGVQERDMPFPRILDFKGAKQIWATVHNKTNSERQFNNLMTGPSAKVAEFRDKICRLNATISNDYIGIDDYKKMEEMEKIVAEQLIKTATCSSPLSHRISEVADILLANLFFFEPDPPGAGPSNSDTYTAGINFRSTPFPPLSSLPNKRELIGSIRCRLARNSPELKQLVNKLDGFWQREVPLGPVRSPQNTPPWTEINFPNEKKRNIKMMGERFIVKCRISTFEPATARQCVAVTMKPAGERAAPVPISGFPVTLEDLMQRAAAT